MTTTEGQFFKVRYIFATLFQHISFQVFVTQHVIRLWKMLFYFSNQSFVMGVINKTNINRIWVKTFAGLYCRALISLQQHYDPCLEQHCGHKEVTPKDTSCVCRRGAEL
jgi:hypothetical protein